MAGAELQRTRHDESASQYLSTPHLAPRNLSTALDDTEPEVLEAAATALRAVAEKRRRDRQAFHLKAHRNQDTHTLTAPMGDACLLRSAPRREVPQQAVAPKQQSVRHDSNNHSHSHSPAFLTSKERLGDTSEFSEDRIARRGLPAPRLRPQKWRVVSKVGLQLAEQKYQAERRVEQRAEQLRAAIVKRYGNDSL